MNIHDEHGHAWAWQDKCEQDQLLIVFSVTPVRWLDKISSSTAVRCGTCCFTHRLSTAETRCFGDGTMKLLWDHKKCKPFLCNDTPNGKIKVGVQRVYVQHQHLKWVLVYWVDIWTSSGQLLRCPVPGKHHGRWSSVQTRAQFVATRVFACIFIAETSIGRRMTREVSAVLSCISSTHSLVRVFTTQEILAVR